MNVSGESNQQSEEHTELISDRKQDEKSQPLKRKSFMHELLSRRVPHIIGVYLAGSWGLLQFIDWIVSRYVLSPYLVDLSAVVLASLIPSIFTLAYFHGKPGRDRWKRSEKVIVPMNLIITISLIAFIFGGKDLSSMSKEVTLTDETGKQITRVVPKSHFRKKVATFFFDNESGDKSLDWMQYGLWMMTAYDLEHEIFIDMITPLETNHLDMSYYIYEKIKKAGYKDGVKLPLLLKKKLADEYRMKYFLSGKILKMTPGKNEFAVEVSLYRTTNTKKVFSKTYRDSDLFALIDEMTVDLKHSLEIPAGHIENSNDLPLKESFTHSVPAVREFGLSIKSMITLNDLKKTQAHLEKALKLDPTFASAYELLSVVYLLQNNMEKSKEVYASLMNYLYKMSERQQFYIKFGYYGAQNDVKKQTAVLDMLIKLYPEDLKAYFLQATMYSMRDYPKAVESYRRILEIDPTRYEVYRDIGHLYKKMGDHTEALTYYRKYADHYPGDYKSFLAIGGLQEELGDFKAAKENYDKALVLQPENLHALLWMADVELKMGNHDAALEQYMDMLTLCKTPRERGLVYSSLRLFYKMRGQINNSLENTQNYLREYKQYGPPLLVAMYSTFLASDYAKVRREDEAFRYIERFKSQFSGPMEKFLSMGYASLYLELGKPDEVEKYLPDIKALIKMTGSLDMKFLYLKLKAMVFQLRGNHNEAVKTFNEALIIKPTDTDTILLLGVSFGKLKDYEKAGSRLEKVLKSNPYHARANLEMAKILLEQGKKEDGLRYLETALNVWKDADATYKPAQSARELMARYR
jgi:tetratricopeptide (TPR) repeat protein